MARITVEDCLKKVSNRFVLVNIASSRVRQIREGAEYLINSPKNEDIVMALREIAAGKVRMKEPVPVKKTTKPEKQPVEKMEEDMNDE
ncbi:MAG: DNA-directed RNA polymerase subunit omega [Desulfobacteraceae bacterium]|nr:DNA-directed RNA polymerase subunit omega [Desulfobacteraceae bacterium]MBU4002199.1 DNA-directed RNA polymerase subunit omega [Pseudomonadota bacterium]MBU4053467.1 DNA-directed RNA polymerase subunit omega [Pseudomonadota bacterium]